MRVGTVCYATSRGLGHLAHDFYLHGIITDILVVLHRGVPTNHDWYPGAPETPIHPFNSTLARDFCAGMDAMLFFETPFDWGLIVFCQHHGIKTCLVTMYECTLKNHLKPDLYICPSLLDLQYFPDGRFIPLPVEYPWRQRDRAALTR